MYAPTSHSAPTPAPTPAPSGHDVPGSQSFFIDLGISVGLVLFSGIASGLTMGLMSLDAMSVAIIKMSGTETERKRAATVEPLIRDRHLLLVTLLITNSACMEALPIFLDKIAGPIVAVALSVSAILMFGEIIPQAVMTKHQLAFGYFLSPLVKILIVALFIIAKPIALILDCVLGTDHEHKYRRAELKELINFHSESNLGSLTIDEVTIIKGVLDMRTKTAEMSMVPFEKVFALPVTATLNRRTMQMINDSGHSRIPVYDGDRENILGMLLVKNLITLDPDENVPISSLRLRKILDISNNYALFDLLNDFQLGGSHMAIVRGVGGNIIGIITLEDIIEELIQEEIEDESDRNAELLRKVKELARHKAKRPTVESKSLGSPSITSQANLHVLRCKSELLAPLSLQRHSSAAPNSPLTTELSRRNFYGVPESPGPTIASSLPNNEFGFAGAKFTANSIKVSSNNKNESNIKDKLSSGDLRDPLMHSPYSQESDDSV